MDKREFWILDLLHCAHRRPLPYHKVHDILTSDLDPDPQRSDTFCRIRIPNPKGYGFGSKLLNFIKIIKLKGIFIIMTIM
jgi:hypothetical protein